MSGEFSRIEGRFRELVRAPLVNFPEARARLDAPPKQGVYVIYSPRGKVLHVGRTPKARGGIAQRLRNHLQAQSSFTIKYLDSEGAKLRRGYTFQCLVVKDPRQRALLEAYAIGRLCPAHIGHGSGGPITPRTR
jgi:hypothetical protein